MSKGRHHYHLTVTWTGDQGDGTSRYDGYGRDHRIESGEKSPIEGSSDPAFRGDSARWNPEELLLAALSACHQLWYLHLCAEAGVVVTAYRDRAEAEMQESRDGGRMVSARLCPQVRLAPGSDPLQAKALHDLAHHRCFIANSVNFLVTCDPEILLD